MEFLNLRRPFSNLDCFLVFFGDMVVKKGLPIDYPIVRVKNLQTLVKLYLANMKKIPLLTFFLLATLGMHIILPFGSKTPFDISFLFNISSMTFP